MSDSSWTDRIVGDRMAVDQQFASTIASSEFTNQQWSLIMTATEFEIEHPADPDRAQLVADTDKVDQILPELDNLASGMGAMGAPGPTDGSGGGSSGSLFDSIRGALGLGDGGGSSDEEKLEAAERLTQDYADQLQEHLESRGKWDAVCEAAADDR